MVQKTKKPLVQWLRMVPLKTASQYSRRKSDIWCSPSVFSQWDLPVYCFGLAQPLSWNPQVIGSGALHQNTGQEFMYWSCASFEQSLFISKVIDQSDWSKSKIYLSMFGRSSSSICTIWTGSLCPTVHYIFNIFLRSHHF